MTAFTRLLSLFKVESSTALDMALSRCIQPRARLRQNDEKSSYISIPVASQDPSPLTRAAQVLSDQPRDRTRPLHVRRASSPFVPSRQSPLTRPAASKPPPPPTCTRPSRTRTPPSSPARGPAPPRSTARPCSRASRAPSRRASRSSRRSRRCRPAARSGRCARSWGGSHSLVRL